MGVAGSPEAGPDGRLRADAKALGEDFLRRAFAGGPLVVGLAWESVTVALVVAAAERSGSAPDAVLDAMMEAAKSRLQLLLLGEAVPAGRA